ncbi:hypothetical protein N0V90_000832 [Kalmusia sp. IMI 367209]|nr:hypothetical protein N0V90_000832 [Kalmusia sp. IMI 367209]
MSTPAFISAFRALQTPAARKEALVALVDHFSPGEWRQMQALANAKSFHLDILGALPAELAIHVFSYLDTSTPFRLQSVSRRWYNLLRGTDIMKRSLKAWYDGTVSFEDASYEDYVQAARSIHRFRTGNHVTVIKTKPDHPHGTPVYHQVDLVEDFLIETSDPRVLRVTNLRTGKIMRVAASDHLVAMWTTSYQKCYVFDLSGVQKAKFRLPNALCVVNTCRDRTIICGGLVDGHVEVYIWNLDSQRGTTLRLDQPLFDHAIDKYAHPP